MDTVDETAWRVYWRDVCKLPDAEVARRMLRLLAYPERYTAQAPAHPNGHTPYVPQPARTYTTRRAVSFAAHGVVAHNRQAYAREDAARLGPLDSIPLEDGSILRLDATTAETRTLYQSTALQVFMSCLEAGMRGGLAAYVHAAKEAQLCGVLPETAHDPRWNVYASQIRGDILSDEYRRYWTDSHYVGQVLDGSTLRNAAYVNLFAGLYERLVTVHTASRAIRLLIPLGRLWQDGIAGRYDVGAGTFVKHVLVSLHHVALQCLAMYPDDDGIYDDIGHADAVGARQWQLVTETLDAENVFTRQWWSRIHQSECPIVPDVKYRHKKQPANKTQARRMRRSK